MLKRIKHIESVEYTLEDKDTKIIKECLNYCLHRKREHNSCEWLNIQELERLRREFGIIKDPDYSIPEFKNKEWMELTRAFKNNFNIK